MAQFYTNRCRIPYGDIEPATFGTGEKRRQGYRYRTIRKGSGGEYIYAELPLPAWEAIAAYLKVSGRIATIKPENPLFVVHGANPHTTPPNQMLSSSGVNHAMKKYLRLAALPLTHTLHSWRHSSAQLRARAGQDLLSLSSTLGHKSIRTTQIYLEGLLGEEDNFVDALSLELGEL